MDREHVLRYKTSNGLNFYLKQSDAALYECMSEEERLVVQELIHVRDFFPSLLCTIVHCVILFCKTTLMHYFLAIAIASFLGAMIVRLPLFYRSAAIGSLVAVVVNLYLLAHSLCLTYLLVIITGKIILGSWYFGLLYIVVRVVFSLDILISMNHIDFNSRIVNEVFLR